MAEDGLDFTLLSDPQVAKSLTKEILGFIQSYIMAGVLIIGIFGNMLSFVIFFRTRKRADACVQYLSILALSDIGVVISRGVTEWVNSGLGYITDGSLSYNMYQYSSLSCKLVAYAQHVTMCISAWMIVSFSSERAFVVMFPLKRTSITTFKRKVLILFICIAMMLSGIQRLVFDDITDTTPKLCFYITEHTLGAILYQIDLTLYNYAPCAIIFVSNTLILAAIIRPSKDKKLLRSTVRTANEGKLLISLMLVSTTYVILLLPFSSVASYTFMNRHNLSDDRAVFIYNIVLFLMQIGTLNYCINFVIYGCTMSFYRQEALKIFSWT
jgi:hypothetical protein